MTGREQPWKNNEQVVLLPILIQCCRNHFDWSVLLLFTTNTSPLLWQNHLNFGFSKFSLLAECYKRKFAKTKTKNAKKIGSESKQNLRLCIHCARTRDGRVGTIVFFPALLQIKGNKALSDLFRHKEEEDCQMVPLKTSYGWHFYRHLDDWDLSKICIPTMWHLKFVRWSFSAESILPETYKESVRSKVM